MSRFWTLAALLLLLGTTACNTMQGFGEDVRRTGAWIERKADR